MFENATTLQIRPGQMAAALRILREAIALVLKQQAGLQGLALLPNDEANEITVLSLWTSAGHARAAEAQCAYRQHACLLDPYLAHERVRLPEMKRRSRIRAALTMN